jgi:hypothetical protein
MGLFQLRCLAENKGGMGGDQSSFLFFFLIILVHEVTSIPCRNWTDESTTLYIRFRYHY